MWNETLILIAFVLMRNDIKTTKNIFRKFLVKQKIVTTNLWIFCKSNNDFSNIIYRIDYTCNKISLISGVTIVWIFMYEKNSKMQW